MAHVPHDYQLGVRIRGEDLEKVDAIADRERMSRSEAVRALLKEGIERREHEEAEDKTCKP